MTGFWLGDHALEDLEEIYLYTIDHWGLEAAEDYSRTLFQAFVRIADDDIVSRPIEPSLGVAGRYTRCASHLIYWRGDKDDRIEIVAILHERMHQPRRLQRAFVGEA